MSRELDTSWFAEGLRFTCTRCGDCCTGEPGFVWVGDEEVVELAQAIGVSTEEFERRYTKLVHGDRTLLERPDGACVLYEAGIGCTLYDKRPTQCRTWPFWNSNIASGASWERTCRKCPGAGQGRLYTVDEIAVLARQIVL